MNKMKIAAMNYEMPKHKSFEDFKKVVQLQVAEAVKHDAEVLLYPEYGSIELVSLMDHWTQKNLHNN
jgi:predicted amidohydrolase